MLLATDAGEVNQSGAHGGGIGVVGIHDDAVLAGLNHLRAAVGGRVSFQSLNDVILVHTEILSHADGGGYVLEVVAAHEMGLDEMLPPAYTQIRVAGSWHNRAEGFAMPAIADAFLSLRLLPQQRVALVDKHGLAMALDMPVKFYLGLDDALKAAEAFQMCFPDVGDEAIVGVGDLAEEIDFTRVAGTHFHDGHLGVRLDAQQGERHADVVVEVAHRVDDVVFLGQHG